MVSQHQIGDCRVDARPGAGDGAFWRHRQHAGSGRYDTQRPRPGWYPGIDTGFTERKQRLPMARLGRPQEVANACLFLASEMATFTTGQELFVSGGTCLLVRPPLEKYEADEF